MSSLSRSTLANITGLKRGFREINYMKPKTLGSARRCRQNTSSLSSSRDLPSPASQGLPLCSIPSSLKTFFPPRPSPCPSVCLSAQDQPHSQAATAPTLSILRGSMSSKPSLQGSDQNQGLETQGRRWGEHWVQSPQPWLLGSTLLLPAILSKGKLLFLAGPQLPHL